jgi:hypothetical protein
VSFFESVPPPKKPKPARQPPWSSQPDNELGVAVPIRFLLAKTDTMALAMTEIVAYSTGFTLRLASIVHHDAKDIDPHQMMRQFHGRDMDGGQESFRFGIEFSDGRKATNLDPHHHHDEEPSINLGRGGGGGGSRGYAVSYFVYPVPPEGPITIAFAWPRFGLREKSIQFEAAPIIEAAAQVEQFWEDNRPFYGDE